MINLALGGDIISDVIGLIVGNVFYFGKEVIPKKYGYEVFPTPNILVNFLYPVKKKPINNIEISDRGYFENENKNFNVHTSNSFVEKPADKDSEFKPLENTLKWN